MKNLSKVIGGVLLLSAFTSCKNDYSCKCTTYKNGTTKTYDTSYTNLIKKDAIFYCDQLESDWMKANLKGDNTDTIYSCNLNKVK